jgi:sulfate adenylyltransferase
MRMAGPKEALLHAIIRRNYGCTHLIIGRGHADPGVDRQGKLYYDPYEAQEITEKYEKELGMSILTSPEMVYEENRKQYVTIDKVKPTDKIQRLSGTMLRQLLLEKKHIPDWFSFPEVIRILRKKTSHYKGLMLFFTGLPCSGKTTISRQLANIIVDKYDRQTTILDGDIVRKFLSRELGFTREDRITNIRRIGFVGSEIVRHGGIVATAALAPYISVREEVRKMVEKYGVFVEIYLSTSIEVCRERDTKGMYKKAELGIIKNFTGVNDVYEKPVNPEIILNTGENGVLECAKKIMDYLKLQNLI